jgi:hypothetical protein
MVEHAQQYVQFKTAVPAVQSICTEQHNDLANRIINLKYVNKIHKNRLSYVPKTTS